MELRLAWRRRLIAWRLNRSFAWNAAHPPKLPPRPRRLPAAPPLRLFDHTLECPVGIAAGPLPNSRWIEAYARLGYGLLTYKTVRTVERAAFPAPNLAFCRLGDPTVHRAGAAPPRPRGRHVGRLVRPAVGQARSLARRRQAGPGKLGPRQILIVSVAGTPAPGGDGEQLAEDYAQAARWAAEAGADVVEVHLSRPNTARRAPADGLRGPGALRAHRRAGAPRRGWRPVVAKLGASRSPRALHELATRLAPWLDGFVLVAGSAREVVTPDGQAAFAGPGRETAEVVGADLYATCRLQVEELIAWRKAGAWDRRILAVGGLTTVPRVRDILEAGASAALVATAALADPLFAIRVRQGR